MSPQKRRLEDLFVIGKEIPFDDGKGDPVTVWLRKLNPIESSTAVRRANAERSRVRAARMKPDSDTYLECYADVLDFGDEVDSLIDYIALDETATAQMQAEAKLEKEEEWAKDDYLTGLQDAWKNGVEQTFILSPEDPDAKQVFSELQRFGDAAAALAEEEVTAIKNGYRRLDIEELRTKATEQMLRYRGSTAWLDEMHRCEIWLGTFDEDHKTKYFGEREEVDHLPTPVLRTLLAEYQELSVDVMEGKDLEATPDSSNLSEPPDEVETVTSSGLAVVSQ